MLTAACHCGALRVEIPRKPRRLTSCNCSICRRYGTLWAYYKAADVRVIASGKTHGYSWGDKALRFVRCARCGCISHWEAVNPKPASRIGVNARNLDPAAIEGVRPSDLAGD